MLEFPITWKLRLGTRGHLLGLVTQPVNKNIQAGIQLFSKELRIQTQAPARACAGCLLEDQGSWVWRRDSSNGVG